MAAIKGLEELQANIEKVKKLEQAFADEFVKRVTDRTPTLTGLLKNSWDIEVKDGAIELRNKATDEQGDGYASFVELGTWKEAPALMITTTLTEKTDILDTAKKKVGL